MVVDSRDKSISNGLDGVIEVGLGGKDIEGCL